VCGFNRESERESEREGDRVCVYARGRAYVCAYLCVDMIAQTHGRKCSSLQTHMQQPTVEDCLPIQLDIGMFLNELWAFASFNT